MHFYSECSKIIVMRFNMNIPIFRVAISLLACIVTLVMIGKDLFIKSLNIIVSL